MQSRIAGALPASLRSSSRTPPSRVSVACPSRTSGGSRPSTRAQPPATAATSAAAKPIAASRGASSCSGRRGDAARSRAPRQDLEVDAERLARVAVAVGRAVAGRARLHGRIAERVERLEGRGGVGDGERQVAGPGAEGVEVIAPGAGTAVGGHQVDAGAGEAEPGGVGAAADRLATVADAARAHALAVVVADLRGRQPAQRGERRGALWRAGDDDPEVVERTDAGCGHAELHRSARIAPRGRCYNVRRCRVGLRCCRRGRYRLGAGPGSHAGLRRRPRVCGRWPL